MKGAPGEEGLDEVLQFKFDGGVWHCVNLFRVFVLIGNCGVSEGELVCGDVGDSGLEGGLEGFELGWVLGVGINEQRQGLFQDVEVV